MDRVAAHKAKMKRKAARVLVPGFAPVEDKRFAQVRLAKRLRGEAIVPNLSRWSRVRPTKNDNPAYRKPYARDLSARILAQALEALNTENNEMVALSKGRLA